METFLIPSQTEVSKTTCVHFLNHLTKISALNINFKILSLCKPTLFAKRSQSWAKAVLDMTDTNDM